MDGFRIIVFILQLNRKTTSIQTEKPPGPMTRLSNCRSVEHRLRIWRHKAMSDHYQKSLANCRLTLLPQECEQCGVEEDA